MVCQISKAIILHDFSNSELPAAKSYEIDACRELAYEWKNIVDIFPSDNYELDIDKVRG